MGFRWHDVTLDAPAAGPNGAAPRCRHADGLAPVTPSSRGCAACTAAGVAWAGLSICLTCGWVACSDRSAGRHAYGHYEETDHPVAERLGPGWRRRWCYVHRRII